MAIRDDFTAGEVLAAADLNDTFAAKLNLAGGKILQIVRATDATNRSTTSTSLVDATNSVTITPQKNNSAIILMANYCLETGGSYVGFTAITDSSNNIISGGQGRFFASVAAATSTSQTIIGYDTPATTSATTYKLRFRSSTANTVTLLNATIGPGQMYAIEVSA